MILSIDPLLKLLFAVNSMNLWTMCYGWRSHPSWPIESVAKAWSFTLVLRWLSPLHPPPSLPKKRKKEKKRATQKLFVWHLNKIVNETRLCLLMLMPGLWPDVNAWPQLAAPRWRSAQTGSLVCTQAPVANFRFSSSNFSLNSSIGWVFARKPRMSWSSGKIFPVNI